MVAIPTRVADNNYCMDMRLSLAGLQISLSCQSTQLKTLLSRWRSEEEDADALSLHMKVDVDNTLRRDLSVPPYFRGVKTLVFSVFASCDLTVFDLQRRTVSAIVSSETETDEAFWNRVLLPILVGIMGPTVGVAPLHCACLDWNGDAVLIAGQS